MSEWFPQSQPQSKPQDEAYPDQPRQPAQPYNHPYGYQSPVPSDEPAAPPPLLSPDPPARAPGPDPYAGPPAAAPAAPYADPYLDPQVPPVGPPPAAPPPGPPGPGGGQPEWWTPAEPDAQPATRSRSAPAGMAQSSGLGRGLAVLAWPALLIGLVVHENGRATYLSDVPAWALFAVASLVLVGVAAFGRASGQGPSRSWTLGAVGAAGLVGFWVLLVLPAIASNTGFALTMATACGCAAVWLAPGRRW